jgi:iron complex outermembrane receptor protein
MGHFKLSAGYTFLYATEEDRGAVTEAVLNPRHSVGAVLFYENEDAGLKTGLETYWTGRQRLERNPYRSHSPSYFISGLIAEKALGHIRLFVNFENIFDTRQTRWDPILTGLPSGAPRTVPIYAPLEGRVVNGGVRFVL